MTVKFVNILNSVINIDCIKSITTKYQNGTNFSNRWIHTLWVEYTDGKTDIFNTCDLEIAHKDYENLKQILLNEAERSGENV